MPGIACAAKLRVSQLLLKSGHRNVHSRRDIPGSRVFLSINFFTDAFRRNEDQREPFHLSRAKLVSRRDSVSSLPATLNYTLVSKIISSASCSLYKAEMDRHTAVGNWLSLHVECAVYICGAGTERALLENHVPWTLKSTYTRGQTRDTPSPVYPDLSETNFLQKNPHSRRPLLPRTLEEVCAHNCETRTSCIGGKRRRGNDEHDGMTRTIHQRLTELRCSQ